MRRRQPTQLARLVTFDFRRQLSPGHQEVSGHGMCHYHSRLMQAKDLGKADDLPPASTFGHKECQTSFHNVLHTALPRPVRKQTTNNHSNHQSATTNDHKKTGYRAHLTTHLTFVFPPEAGCPGRLFGTSAPSLNSTCRQNVSGRVLAEIRFVSIALYFF